MFSSNTSTSTRRLPQWGIGKLPKIESPTFVAPVGGRFRSHAVAVLDRDALSPFVILEEARRTIEHHPLFAKIASGQLSVARLRRVLISVFPLLNAYADLSEQTARNIDTHSWAQRELQRWLRYNLRVVRRYPIRYREFAEIMGVAPNALTTEPDDSMKTLLGLAWQRQRSGDVALSLALGELGLGWILGELAGALVRGYPGHREAFDNRFELRPRRQHTREAATHLLRTTPAEQDLALALDATKRTLELGVAVLESARLVPASQS